MEKKYYRSFNELVSREKGFLKENHGIESYIQNKNEPFPTSRRNFLKLFGYAIASTSVLASCEQPVQKAIPYLIKPDSITPGKANYYASTFFDGNDYCSILVKVRDGRPIKIEGNSLSSVTKGGTSALVQASILNLYDTNRFQFPMISGNQVDWIEIDNEIINKLNNIKDKNGSIVLLSSTINSPSTLSVINEFKNTFPTFKHIQYDPISYNALTLANLKTFGKEKIPSYNFDKAKMIVSFGADFLGTWLMPIEFTKQYSSGRKLEDGQKEMSYHIQYEAGMSLTGSNADKRVILKNSKQKIVLANLYNKIAKIKGIETLEIPDSPLDITGLAQQLLDNEGYSLVICGSNDTNTQIIVNGINYLLNNYENTIDINSSLILKNGNDAEMNTLIEEMDSGKISAIFLYDVNPGYNYPENEKFISALNKVELSVSMPVHKDETSDLCMYICPSHHYLEAWNDFEIKPGFFSLAQPAIHPIFNTRAMQESLLTWAGKSTDYQEFIKNFWGKNIFQQSGSEGSFLNFWNSSIQDGIFEQSIQINSHTSINYQPISEAISQVKTNLSEKIELELYENISIGEGKHANNPWLQELPDPISKVTWDNYANISPKLAEELNLIDGDMIKINDFIDIPILIQPGQEYKTISVALGYGRQNAGQVANGVGINIYPLVNFNGETRLYSISNIQIEKTGENYEFAMTQTHHSMEGRAIIRETTLEEYLINPSAGNEIHEEIEEKHSTLYKEKEYNGHHWGLVIDLNSCTGCNACIVACSAENNVPVVGKKQVSMAREMHWIRIDRYYSGDPENPEVARQPVMCQHCDNAPCENVCPVAATTHSSEGINQMAYNRCIGTRYCNNNCPFKVRRFNFLDYTKSDSIPANTYDPAGMTVDLKRMVLNPDVTVRAKGVIEKCSMCVQRIQENKLNAKLENRMLKDGEIQPACAQSCPAKAIIFGDLNDENSIISKLFKDKRNYHLMEELHTLPSVGYLTKVKNIKT